MSKTNLSEVQKSLDGTVRLLLKLASDRRLSTCVHDEILARVLELQEYSRLLPQLAGSPGGFSAVFKTIDEIIRRFLS